jgi:hypothetical protein
MADSVANSKKSSIDIINECKAALAEIDKPFFLYLMTVDETEKSILTVAYKNYDKNVDSLTRLDNKSLEGIEGSIKDHIDAGLRKIYNENLKANTVAVNSTNGILSEAFKNVTNGTTAKERVNVPVGGSRSQKKRRRNKRKHNTKRRSRK